MSINPRTTWFHVSRMYVTGWPTCIDLRIGQAYDKARMHMQHDVHVTLSYHARLSDLYEH